MLTRLSFSRLHQPGLQPVRLLFSTDPPPLRCLCCHAFREHDACMHAHRRSHRPRPRRLRRHPRRCCRRRFHPWFHRLALLHPVQHRCGDAITVPLITVKNDGPRAAPPLLTARRQLDGGQPWWRWLRIGLKDSWRQGVASARAFFFEKPISNFGGNSDKVICLSVSRQAKSSCWPTSAKLLCGRLYWLLAAPAKRPFSPQKECPFSPACKPPVARRPSTATLSTSTMQTCISVAPRKDRRQPCVSAHATATPWI